MTNLCTRCDGDGFDAAYVGNCERCGGSGHEPTEPTGPNMAGVIARSLDLNDDQYAADEISHATWSETYIALLNYATRHGIAEQVFDAAGGFAC